MLKLPMINTPVYKIRQPRFSCWLQTTVLFFSIIMIIFFWAIIQSLQESEYIDFQYESRHFPTLEQANRLKPEPRKFVRQTFDSRNSFDSSEDEDSNATNSDRLNFLKIQLNFFQNSTYSSTESSQIDRFLISRNVLTNLHQPLMQPSKPNLICPPGTLKMFYVISAAQNMAQRLAIRQTWARAAKQMGNTGLLFVVGVSSSQQLNEAIKLEQNVYDDLLQLNAREKYELLTQKTIGAFQHALDHCSHVPYLLKCDDDMFINAPLLEEWIVNDWIRFQLNNSLNAKSLSSNQSAVHKSNQIEASIENESESESEETPTKSNETNETNEKDDKQASLLSNDHPKGDGFICYLLKLTQPFRTEDSKWYVPEWVYPLKYYPPYCNGPFYILRNTSLPALMAAANQRDLLFLEDVHFTGLIRVDAGRPPIRNLKKLINFNSYSGCGVQRKLSTHAVKTPSRMRQMWATLNTYTNC